MASNPNHAINEKDRLNKPDRRGPDDADNTYVQWRDDYLTQVDADFEYFRRANEEARHNALAESQESDNLSFALKSAETPYEPSIDTYATQWPSWHVFQVKAEHLPMIRTLGVMRTHLGVIGAEEELVTLAAPRGEGCNNHEAASKARSGSLIHDGFHIHADALRVKSNAVASYEHTHSESIGLWPLLNQTENENVYRANVR